METSTRKENSKGQEKEFFAYQMKVNVVKRLWLFIAVKYNNSETTNVWVLASRMCRSSSLILSCI